MTDAPEWAPPPDPDFAALAGAGWEQWLQDEPNIVAFDTETSGFLLQDEAFCFTFAWLDATRTIQSAYFELDRINSSYAVKEILNSTPILVGHNVKFDLHRAIRGGFLERSDVKPNRIHDTEALAHLDNEHRRKGLKELAVSVLGIEEYVEVPYKNGPKAEAGEVRMIPKEKWEIEQAKKWAKKEFGYASVKDIGYDVLPRGTIVPYALKDAEFTLELYHVLRPRVELYDDLWTKYEEELALTLVYLDSEANGMAVDVEYVDAQIKEITRRIRETEMEIEGIVQTEVISAVLPRGTKKDEAGKFNPVSNPQLAAYFRGVGYPRPNYDKGVLEEIDHPLARALLTLRKDVKLRSTYFLALKAGTHEGIFHPNIRQHGTVTGRTSSGKAVGD